MRRIITGIVVAVTLAFLVSGCAVYEDLTRDTPGETRTKREAAIRSTILRLQTDESASEVGRTAGETEARIRFDRMPPPFDWAIKLEAIARLRRSNPSFDYAYRNGFVTGWNSIGNGRYPNRNAEARLAERDFEEGKSFRLPLPNDATGSLEQLYRIGWALAEERARMFGANPAGGSDPNYKIGGGDGGE